MTAYNGHEPICNSAWFQGLISLLKCTRSPVNGVDHVSETEKTDSSILWVQSKQCVFHTTRWGSCAVTQRYSYWTLTLNSTGLLHRHAPGCVQMST